MDSMIGIAEIFLANRDFFSEHRRPAVIGRRPIPRFIVSQQVRTRNVPAAPRKPRFGGTSLALPLPIPSPPPQPLPLLPDQSRHPGVVLRRAALAPQPSRSITLSHPRRHSITSSSVLPSSAALIASPISSWSAMSSIHGASGFPENRPLQLDDGLTSGAPASHRPTPSRRQCRRGKRNRVENTRSDRLCPSLG